VAELGIMIESQDGTNWDRWNKLIDACHNGGLNGLWRSDHLFSLMGDTTRDALALVPARTLVDAAKTLAPAGEITLALGSESDDSLIGLAAGGRHTTSRLIDGEWVPNYRRLFPAEIATVAKVEIDALIDSVKRVALVAERNTPVRLAFDDGQVVLEAGSGEDAQASEALQAHVDGPAIATGFNPTYLLDGLQALGTPFVHMSFTDTPLKPVVVEGIDSLEGQPSSGYRYLAMPIRLSS
jgi:DNA polymerase III subunit beta